MAQKSLGRKYAIKRNTIKEYLTQKGLYDPTDDILIEELIYNLYIADEAKANVELNGITIGQNNTTANPAVYMYNSAVKNISTIATKLGITIQEKKKLKPVEQEDDIDDILNL